MNIDKLHAERHALQKVMVEMIGHAGGVRESKEFGCERCSDCTVRIARALENSIANDSLPPEPVIVNIQKFLHFPRALLSLIRGALVAARNAETPHTGESLATQVCTICELAEEAFDEWHFLAFARTAAVLSSIDDEIESTFRDLPLWPGLKKKLQVIKDKTVGIVEHFSAHIDEFQDLEENTRQRVREKRMRGGGYILSAPRPNKTGDPVFVVDFSRTHILTVVKARVTNSLRGWAFMPCQRELPFNVDAFPVRRNGDDELIQVASDSLKKCGNYYQLFRIDKVRPQYYYDALCATLTTKHPAATDKRLVDCFDWPRVPRAELECTFCAATH